MDQLIYFFSTLGVFNGVLLSLYLFFFTKKKSLSKFLLGALILALSIRLGKSIILYFDRSAHKVILQIGLSACLFIGPFLYFYLNSVLKGISQMPKQWTRIILILTAIILITGAIKPYHIFPDFWNTYMVQSIYSIWFISVVASGVVLLPTISKLFRSPLKLENLEKWLLVIYLGNVIICTTYLMAFFGFSVLYYISGPLVFSFFLYLLFFGYFNERWFDIEEKPTVKKYNNRIIPPSLVESHSVALQDLMKNEKVYNRSDLKLSHLAQMMGISTHQLSQLLNDNLKSSFKDYINQHRIQAACEMIKTDNRLSLEGIGYEVGFRSKSTFFTTFKKLVEMTPAQYKERMIEKKT